jgi:hypothetical protein
MNYLRKQLPILLPALLLAPLPAQADNGFVLAGSVGSSTLEESFEGFGIDTSATAWRFTAGWQFSDYFTLEAGYHDFGEFDQRFDLGDAVAIASVEADGYTLGAALGLPLGDNLTLFARGGAFIWEAEARLDKGNFDFPEDANPYYGAGADLMVTRRLSLVGDWTRYELDSVESDVISLGFRYRF